MENWILETTRLTLRCPDGADTADYLEFRNSEFVLRYNAMKPLTWEEAYQELTREDNPGSVYVLEAKETGKVFGMIYISEDSIRWGIDSKEISYFLHEGYSRQGYMKEALTELIRHLFEEEKLDCIAARAFADNEASINLLKSLGFHQDGLIPKCVKGYRDVIFDDTIHSLMRK